MRINRNRPALLLLSAMVPVIMLGHPLDVRGETPAPPKTHAERFTFDEKTGQWLVTPSPIPGTEDGDLDIARQWLAREGYTIARKAMREWMKKYGSASPRYPEAVYVLGAAYLGEGDYRSAHDNFQKLLNDFPGSEYAEKALKAEFTVGEQYMAGKKRKAFWGIFRVKDREGGVKIMDDMVANYSDTPLAEMAQMSKADYYYARGEFELAVDEYSAFATQFPTSGWRSRALLRSGLSALASFPGVKFDDAGLVEAQERLRDFRQGYPQVSEQNNVPALLDEIAAKRAEKTYEIGRFYDKSRKFTAATYYYRAAANSWPGTPAAARSEARLVELGQPLTPGIVAPNTPPSVAPPAGQAKPTPPNKRERTNESLRQQINEP